MTSTSEPKSSPIEVWLHQGEFQVTCRVIRDDETDSNLDVDAYSMRGAQREITAYLIRDGYTPIGRWSIESDDGEDHALETVRRFKLA